MEELTRRFTSLKPLMVFAAVARRGSFSRAAQVFNLSQPSISRNISQLERDIGLPLFERRSDGVRLTEGGRELFTALQEGFGRIAETIEKLEKRRDEAHNIVSLSVSSSFVAHWLAPRLASFRQRFPDVRLRFELISGTMTDLPQDVDLATRIVSRGETDWATWDLAPEIIIPVCSPGYLEESRTTDAPDHTFLHLSDHPRSIWDGIELAPFNRLGGPDRWHEFSDYSVILQAALDGTGVALGWLSVISSLLRDGKLVPAGGRPVCTGRTHRLIDTGTGPDRPVVADIAAWLVERMAEDILALEPVLRDSVTLDSKS